MTVSTERRFRGASDLALVGRQVYYEQLNFWLNPVAALFTIGFSVVFLILLAWRRNRRWTLMTTRPR